MRGSVRHLLLCLGFAFLPATSTTLAQSTFSLQLVGRTQIADRGNDIWGYTAPDGTEYAIMGTRDGIAFVQVPDLNVVARIPQAPGSWRDMKTYGSYAYAVSEQTGTNAGLLVMDLSPLPDSVHVVQAIKIRDLAGVDQERSHNLYIDTEAGYAYVVERNYDGVIIFSLADPANPLRVTGVRTPDAHDVFVQDSLLYIAEGTSRSFSVWDVRPLYQNLEPPELITRFTVPGGGYAHNIWVTEDGQFAMTTEETVGQTVKVWDLRDLPNVSLIADYLAPNNLAHNTHIKDGFAYISHYTAGVVVVDLRDPFNPTEVARYDTFPENDAPRFQGCWGAYPFTGNYVYTSDIEGYLTVLEFKAEPLPATSCPLIEGWNLVSSPVRPNQPQIEAVTQEIADNLVLVKDDAGAFYWPDQRIEALNLWDDTEAYGLFMKGDDTLTFAGPTLTPSISLSLRAGWNSIPYRPETMLSAPEALGSIARQFVLAKDVNGLPYWPDQNLNALGQMQPCQGYHVYMRQAADLSYPETSKRRRITPHHPRATASHFRPRYVRTGTNATLLVESPDLANGDEVGVWADGVLAGSGVVEDGRALIVVWGDNTVTADRIDGALNESALDLRIWQGASAVEGRALIETVLDGLTGEPTELTYTDDAVFLVSLVAGSPVPTTSDQPVAGFTLEPNYPNPFRTSTTLRYELATQEHVRITVHDALGRPVQTLVDESRSPGVHSATFSGTDLPAGVYFYSVEAGSFKTTRRMTLVH